jgi:glycosyltransferase involved in cell wall biosynthesis
MTLPLRGRSAFELLEDSTLAFPRKSGSPVVLYHAPWTLPDDGWSISSRATARAMNEAGLDVRLVSFDEKAGEIHPAVMDEVRPCLKYADRWDLHLLSTAITYKRHALASIGTLAYDSARSAMHVMFERLHIEPELAEALNSLHGVFTHCSANRDVLAEANVRDVEVIGIPWFESDPLLQVPKPTDSKKFLWVGRAEFRKSPDRLVRAFLRAFPKTDEATLTLKVSEYGTNHAYPSIDEIVEQELLRHSRVMSPFRIVYGRLSAEKMRELYASHDVYCSASRGEGWDLPAYHMKLAGRRVVSTDSGGPRDFVGDGDTLVPQTGEVLDHLGHAYADHDLDHLVQALQLARSKPGPGSRPPVSLRSDEVGSKFKRWVERLTA